MSLILRAGLAPAPKLPWSLRGCQARLLLLLQHHYSKHQHWKLQMEFGKEILQRRIYFLPKFFHGRQT